MLKSIETRRSEDVRDSRSRLNDLNAIDGPRSQTRKKPRNAISWRNRKRRETEYRGVDRRGRDEHPTVPDAEDREYREVLARGNVGRDL